MAKKQAKVSSRRKAPQDQGTTVAPTMIDAGHRVSDTTSFWTACGAQRRPGWWFGTPEDVTCADCQEGQ